ncbi:MAG: hypothetical protein EPO25_02425 [Gammaproteobacteria bacterium]|nr:MAG: hypothetical protein EPO25_02425 [Gammaproteobacteria bacterium]
MGPLGTRYARNLTPDRETGIGAQTDAQLARALRTGVMHDTYLRSLEPIRNPVPRGEWALFGKLLFTYALPRLTPRPVDGPPAVPAGDSPTIERGAYLAKHVALCLRCHAAVNPRGFDPGGPPGGGGLPGPSHGEDRDMEFVAPNLSSHTTGYTGRVSEDEFVQRLRAGRIHASSLMPWESFAATSEVDLRSIYRYLKTLPPVDNDVGPTYRKRG